MTETVHFELFELTKLALVWLMCQVKGTLLSLPGIIGLTQGGIWASQVALVLKNPPANAGDIRDMGSIPESVSSLEKEMATHSSVLAWRIPRTEEPGGLQSIGLHKVRQDWNFLAHIARRYLKTLNSVRLLTVRFRISYPGLARNGALYPDQRIQMKLLIQSLS